MRPGACAGDRCDVYALSTRADFDGSIYQLDAFCGYPMGGSLGMVRAPAGEVLPQERARLQAKHENDLEMTRLDPARVEETLRRHSGERPCFGCGSLVEPRYLRSVDGREFCPDCMPEGGLHG